MATGDSGLPSAEYTTQLDDSDESSSEYDITWSPGDGVCPRRPGVQGYKYTRIGVFSIVTDILI
ncbi:hypothetical protein BDV41DRAFT_400224 [Aspergillus transmontanensis]|uniref:Uncharacterized protein n=1 Tax=Aspergillus transmontanensis TaxID=1034304 RepID=A0A5N6VT07_9EURO|nr:hypothetical protein BDV41DRAFT_400224 [Aspergillus transmontanensis]